MCIDSDPASRFTKDRYIIWVTAEPVGIASEPFERQLLIHQGIVGDRVIFGIQRGVREEAKRPKPVVDRDNDDIAFLDKPSGVIDAASAPGETTAMDPN